MNCNIIMEEYDINIYKPGEYDRVKIEQHLIETSDYFTPPTIIRVNIKDWAQKLYSKSTIFELVINKKIAGLAALYFNRFPEFSYGTHVCVLKKYQKDMYGVELIIRVIDYARKNGSGGFRCEIRKSNRALVRLYQSLGFSIEKEIKICNSDEVGLIISKTF